jgi:hypothetical protein
MTCVVRCWLFADRCSLSARRAGRWRGPYPTARGGQLPTPASSCMAGGTLTASVPCRVVRHDGVPPGRRARLRRVSGCSVVVLDGVLGRGGTGPVAPPESPMRCVSVFKRYRCAVAGPTPAIWGILRVLGQRTMVGRRDTSRQATACWWAGGGVSAIAGVTADSVGVLGGRGAAVGQLVVDLSSTQRRW